MKSSDWEKLKDLHPFVRAKAIAAIEEIEAQGIECRVIHAYRSPSEQEEIYAKGRVFENGEVKKVGTTFTNARAWQSYHQWRCALDVAPKHCLDEPNWATNDPAWKVLRTVAMAHGFDTIKWDKPHWEMSGEAHWSEMFKSFPDGMLPLAYFGPVPGENRDES